MFLGSNTVFFCRVLSHVANGRCSKEAHVSAFVMLAALCKMATGMLRTLSDGELVARDLGNKVGW